MRVITLCFVLWALAAPLHAQTRIVFKGIVQMAGFGYPQMDFHRVSDGHSSFWVARAWGHLYQVPTDSGDLLTTDSRKCPQLARVAEHLERFRPVKRPTGVEARFADGPSKGLGSSTIDIKIEPHGIEGESGERIYGGGPFGNLAKLVRESEYLLLPCLGTLPPEEPLPPPVIINGKLLGGN